ncbi:MAG: hypothetical protein M1814_000571 [Vezdaea aestivalis]|nr:MAG: hypothetical protein M1814_000571 [Vezdaea aestivalis]
MLRTPICDEAAKCAKLFVDLQKSTQPLDTILLGVAESPKISLDQLLDVRGRFKIWTGNIGVLQRGKASLDYRLCHSDLRQEIVRLLKQLIDSQTRLLEITSGARTEATWSTFDLISFSDLSDDSDSEYGDPKDEEDDGELISQDQAVYQKVPEDSQGDDGSITPEIFSESKELYYGIVESITSLFKLSMFVQKSTRRRKFHMLSTEKPFDPRLDILHITDRFPHAKQNESILSRLGKANVQRRQWLAYKKRHRNKLAVETKEAVSQPDTDPAGLAKQLNDQDDPPGATAPSEYHGSVTTDLSATTVSTFHGNELPPVGEERASEGGFSETSYGATVFGDPSQSTIQNPRPPPGLSYGNPFECPYCFTIIIVSDLRSWISHVHHDLSSYTCTYKGCSHPLFESRHQWFAHELENHRKEWECDYCLERFPSSKEFGGHMNQTHTEKFVSNQLDALTERAERLPSRIAAADCPLCDYDTILGDKLRPSNPEIVRPSQRLIKPEQFRSHLGRHLEQIALFVLPSNEIFAADDDIETSGGRGAASVLSGDVGSPEASDSGSEQEFEEIDDLLGDLKGLILGFDSTNDNMHIAPDFALGWQPPSDFQPPEEDFNVDDIDWLPRREDPMFSGDLFTPGWVRGPDHQKEGYCGRCVPGIWRKMGEDGTYESNLTYVHGVDPSGVPLPRPSQTRQNAAGVWEGFCVECDGWRTLRKTRAGWNWFRHCIKEHGGKKLDESEARIRPEELSTSPRTDALLGERLLKSVVKADLESSAAILRSDARALFYQNKAGQTPLHVAANVGDVGLIRILLEESTLGVVETQDIINAFDNESDTPLSIAAYQGHEDVVRCLIELGADVNVRHENGLSALDRAAEGGFSAIAKYLIEGGANIEDAKLYLQTRRRNMLNSRERKSRRKSHQDPLDQLPVSTSAESIEGSDPGTTSLATHVENNDILAVRAALQLNIDIEDGSFTGLTPLLNATMKGYIPIAELLLTSGANPNVTSPKGWTVLMHAVRQKSENLVHLLLQYGADTNHMSPDRWNALIEATVQRNHSMMGSLLRVGCDTESKSSSDWTPLMHASYTGDEAGVELLLSSGADASVVNARSETSLMLATAGGYVKIVRMVLAYGCPAEADWAVGIDLGREGDQSSASSALSDDPDRIALGWTPLMLAAQVGSKEITEMLLAQNVNTKLRSPYRNTAVDVAIENGHMEIVELLQKHEQVVRANPQISR